MPILIKVALNAKELDEVFRLRHKVYVEQEGVFKGGALAETGVLYDRFDTLPQVANLIAYADGEPIGTMRINLDTGTGLPADDLYDYSEYRNKITQEWLQSHQEAPRFVGAGMLAISSGWRNRRDVIRALFKMAAGLASKWGSTHIIASVNAKTVGMYKRCGFESLAGEQWIEKIGDHIVPVVGLFEDYYNWAFASIIENRDFLDFFANRVQHLILNTGETLFKQGDNGDEAYLIENGTIRIWQNIPDSSEETTLATLGAGEMLGEVSLIDKKPRSAQATALTKAELISLASDDFQKGLQEQPCRMQDMLKIFATRIRRSNKLVAALQGSALSFRLEHALEDIRRSAVKDTKKPGALFAKIGPSEFAHTAGVSEEDARDFLEAQRMDNRVEYSEHRIRFLETG